jgi:integrase
LALVLVKTGIRREECAGLCMDWINWQERTILLAPHRKRTHRKAYFDEEAEHFLRLKCEKNRKECPGNPYLWPSPEKPGQHVVSDVLAEGFKRMVKNSPLGPTIHDWTDRMQKITLHTGRRAFTSWLKTNGCPPHIVAILRGDSLRSRSELVSETTQGGYTKMGKKGGVDELRYWYDKTMPRIGAREAWESITPSVAQATTVASLLRVAERRQGVVTVPAIHRRSGES